jgi:uncharacterized protein YecE (DUF72 family)
MLDLYTGTSGFAYKEWKGSFYPEKFRNDEMLQFYASRFRAVEINNTFYRMPSSEVLARWRDAVPAEFRFVLKASRRITHQKRLKNSADSLRYLLETSATLGDKLGPLLFQLPPNMKADLDRLTDFLALIPRDCRAAFEFRHSSWFEDPVFEALRSRGAALCVADTGGEDDPPFVATADWGYLRLRGEAYDDSELDEWARAIREPEWRDAFVFFKHEDQATGPALAARFEERFA